eukprot:scaffold576_cov260-Pinguiococcus_pyrenoidosus.AAC.75
MSCGAAAHRVRATVRTAHGFHAGVKLALLGHGRSGAPNTLHHSRHARLPASGRVTLTGACRPSLFPPCFAPVRTHDSVLVS